jgi:RNA-dependent RNA polymerase
MICNGLRDFNIDIVPLPNFKLVTDREPPVWQYIDRPISQDTGYGLSGLHELIAADTPLLRFPVRYQLEVCISEGVLNEHNMTKQFVDTLAVTEPTKAQALLEYVASKKKRIYNPMEIFNLRIIGDSASRLPIPHYCTYVRSATVTPTMVYFNSPSIETSNRVLRQYREHADRFLRVRFTDEKFQVRICYFSFISPH